LCFASFAWTPERRHVSRRLSGDRGAALMEAREFWVAAALLWLCGVALRVTILAVPPVITAIQSDLGLSGTEVGILSALPVIVFGVFALPGALVVARLGIVYTMVLGLAIGAAGAMLRGAATGVAVLFASTVVMGAGIAMMQVALPAAVRGWTPARVGFATALYTNGLLVGEVLPVALTDPWVLPLAGGSWRASLALWGLPLLLVAALTWVAAPPIRSGVSAPARWWPDWNRSLQWRLGLIFGSITSTYFNANAFLPGYLAGIDRTDLIPGALTALNGGQLPVSFLLLVVAGRLERRAWPLILTGAASLIALIAMVSSGSGWTIASAGVLGGVLAAALTFAMMLPPLLAAPDDVARMTAGMLAIGYTMAVVTSVISGACWDLAGSARAAFLPVAIGLLPILLLPATIRFDAGREGQGRGRLA
jgi:CP family cyanate transporter-like MFS transporter